MKANPRPSLLDRRARAHLWLLAPLLGASAVAVVVTATFPPLPVVAVCVAFAVGGWVGVWAVRPLAPSDPSSQPRPLLSPDEMDAVARVATAAQVIEVGRPAPGIYSEHETAVGEDLGVLRVGAHSLEALAEAADDTATFPQVRA